MVSPKGAGHLEIVIPKHPLRSGLPLCFWYLNRHINDNKRQCLLNSTRNADIDNGREEPPSLASIFVERFGSFLCSGFPVHI